MTKIVYICSAARSGSTLLDLLIGSHSKVESLGEITQLPKNISLNTICTCGLHVRSCPVWWKVLKIMSNNLAVDLFKNPYALNLGYINPRIVIDKNHQTKIYNFRRKIVHGLWYLELRFRTRFLRTFLYSVNNTIENNFLLYDTVREVLNSDMIVDSSKNGLKCIELYNKKPHEVKIILLTRDGRGVFCSQLKMNFTKRNSLNAWKNYYARIIPLLEHYVDPSHLLWLKYEELATAPRMHLERICEFLGLEYEENMLYYANQTHHSIGGNDMRLQKSSQIKLDISWHEKLSDEDIRYFEARAGYLNRKLGYE